jgi:type I restriction enzyme, S subunit
MADLSTPTHDAQSVQTTESLITQHLDTWTTAIEQKSTAGRGSSKKFSLYGIKKLRELILELAVRGKLVPQEPSDEPAAVLLERIAAEKAQLVKEGKLKKQKPLPEISDDEKPFELPQGWAWMCLSSIGVFSGGKTPSKANTSYWNGSIPWVTPKDMKVDRIYDSEDHVTQLAINDGLAEVPKESLLFVARSGILRRKFPAAITKSNCTVNQDLKVLTLFDSSMANYVLLMMNGFESYILNNLTKMGTTVESLRFDDFSKHYFLLPPLEEQHRIVAKVDELMSLCDALEAQTEASIAAHQTLVETLLNALLQPNQPAASPEPSLIESFIDSWDRIAEHFDTLFTTSASIDTLKQTILQLAVMGKLVEQDVNDEPAAKLLQRIASEKAQLIKDGKIKKQKPLPAITDEEKPFELPQGWEWSRFGLLGYDMGGGTPSKSNSDYWNGDIPWVSPKDMKRHFIDTAIDSVSKKAVEETTIKLVPVNSLLMVVRGMILAHSFPVAITLKPVVINQDMKALVFNFLEPEFVLLMMKGLKSKMVGLVDRSSHGTCKLVSDKLWGISVAIPPLEEQYRIVARVDELMALCDQLKTRLSDAQTTQLHLTDAIVEQAV